LKSMRTPQNDFEKADFKRLKDHTDELEREVLSRRSDWDLKTTDKSRLDKYNIAVNMRPYVTTDANNRDLVDREGMGLVLLGLQQLRDIKLDTLTKEELILVTHGEISLLLGMGRAAEVGDILEDKKVQPMLGRAFYHYRLLLAAAKGDYAGMEENLVALEQGGDPGAMLEVAGNLLGIGFLNGPLDFPAGVRLARFSTWAVAGFRQQRDLFYRMAVEPADLRLLRGIFALEAGNTDKAYQLIDEAIKIAGSSPFWQDRPVAMRYLVYLKEQRENK